MRQIVRRIFVSLLTVAFVFSGVTWAACIDLPVAQAETTTVSLIATYHNQHHAIFANHGDHQSVGGGHLASVSDQDSLPDRDIAPVIKCCSMVPVVSLTPNLLATTVKFSGATASFRVAQRDLVGCLVAVEPGIPKRIV